MNKNLPVHCDDKFRKDTKNGGEFITLLGPKDEWLADIRENGDFHKFVELALNSHYTLVGVLQSLQLWVSREAYVYKDKDAKRLYPSLLAALALVKFDYPERQQAVSEAVARMQNRWTSSSEIVDANGAFYPDYIDDLAVLADAYLDLHTLGRQTDA